VVHEPVAGEDGPIWHIELLDDPLPEKRPHTFRKIDYAFGILDAAVMCLDGAPVQMFWKMIKS
jgi:hypothetical protein